MLAVMHHNENVNRPVLLDDKGVQRVEVWWPKYLHGERAAPSLIRSPTTYGKFSPTLNFVNLLNCSFQKFLRLFLAGVVRN